MIAPWRTLNNAGRLLTICCVINVIVAVILANSGSYFAIFSMIMAMGCGISTYNPKYQYHDADDINNNLK
jgi:hypothetical protein